MVSNLHAELNASKPLQREGVFRIYAIVVDVFSNIYINYSYFLLLYCTLLYFINI